MFPPGIEPGTLRVWGARDNRYTTETSIFASAHIIGFMLFFPTFSSLRNLIETFPLISTSLEPGNAIATDLLTPS